jgi:hypothetical protein
VPDTVTAYCGTLPYRDAPEDIADRVLVVTENAPRPGEGVFDGGSPYRRAFRNGATLYPRMLCFIDRAPAGRLGMNPAAPRVVSHRSSQEKPPWKGLPNIEANVEASFLHPVLLGESIVPYRIFRAFESVVPAAADGTPFNSNDAAGRGYSGLHSWMAEAERLWQLYADSAMTFQQQLNYHNKLSAQFPIGDLRLVFAKAGAVPAAAILRNNRTLIENTLYWARFDGEAEARFLCAILNSETARARVAAMQARGQWGARHFDKVMFTLPIPPFDAAKPLHRELAAAAAEAETIAAAVDIPDRVGFQRARRLVRDALAAAGVAKRIDALVAQLLDS